MLRFFLCLIIAAAAPAGRDDDIGAIRAARARQNAAIVAHHLDGIAGAWEPDVAVTAGMGIAFRGSDEYRKAFEEEFAAFPDTKYERTPESIEVSKVRPLASERGTWTRNWTGKRGPGQMRGPYMAMWQKTDNQWRIRSELFVLLECSGPGCPTPKAP